jgi:hypothetical protein
MANYGIFAYVFKRKPNVVEPVDVAELDETHYLCVHREPVAELGYDDPKDVFLHFYRLALSPSWYKRGLEPLKCTDIVWFDGLGYMLLPNAACCEFYTPMSDGFHLFDGICVHEKEIDPGKVLSACKDSP